VQPELISESIALDTESKPDPAEIDSVSSDPIALDTESKPESAEIDSVSSDPIALDTESKPESAEIDSVSGPVGVYCPKGSTRSGELKYFRYSYRGGRKMKHVHIFGGCTRVRVAQERAAEVMEIAARCRSSITRYCRWHQKLEQKITLRQNAPRTGHHRHKFLGLVRRNNGELRRKPLYRTHF